MKWCILITNYSSSAFQAPSPLEKVPERRMRLGVGMAVRQNPYASFASNQTGGRVITTEAAATQSSIAQAIEYVKQSGALSDIFKQITNGSLGNTDFVFDITNAANAAGHSGIFAISQDFGDFSFEISEYVHNGAVDASQLTADMPLQIKLLFGKYDPRNKTDVGYNIETIAHETVLHITAMITIIKFLRSGAPVQSVLDKWYKESQAGGNMNDDKQHIEFTKSDTKIRKIFNSIIGRILKGIKNITHRKQLNKAVSDDVNFQKKYYKVK
jgi:hypothetical protein